MQEIGASTSTLLTGLGVDEYLTRTDATGTRTRLTDALGSTVALTDAVGAVQSEYTYEPFGATTETGPDANPFQYTGRENDGTGLYYYRARYYHPTLQRFISDDPIGFASGEINHFVYVRNRPTRYVDPLGLTWNDILWGLKLIKEARPALTVPNGAQIVPSIPSTEEYVGQWNSLTKTMYISKKYLDDLSDVDAMDLLVTLVHETQHANQSWWQNAIDSVFLHSGHEKKAVQLANELAATYLSARPIPYNPPACSGRKPVC